MYNRFKTALFQPAKIANYQNDSRFKTFVYYFLLAFLAIIPSIILIFSSAGLDYKDKLEIRTKLKNEDIPYEIIDHKLVKKETAGEEPLSIKLSETIEIIFQEAEAEEIEISPLHIGSIMVFSNDKVVYYTQFFDVIEIEYSDYSELENLDFVGATNNDSAFWDKVFPVVNNALEEHGSKTRIMNSVGFLLAQALFLMFFSLLVALFQRIRLASVFTFAKIWQLVIYAMTPYIVLTLIGDLFGLTFLSTIGVIVSYIYANLMSKAIIKK